jgi:hypothetical protein
MTIDLAVLFACRDSTQKTLNEDLGLESTQVVSIPRCNEAPPPTKSTRRSTKGNPVSKIEGRGEV